MNWHVIHKLPRYHQAKENDMRSVPPHHERDRAAPMGSAVPEDPFQRFVDVRPVSLPTLSKRAG